MNFLLVWLISGLLLFHIMICVRKIMGRDRGQPIIKELTDCLLFGPLLVLPVLYIGIGHYFGYRSAILKKINKKLERISSRFDILDIR